MVSVILNRNLSWLIVKRVRLDFWRWSRFQNWNKTRSGKCFFKDVNTRILIWDEGGSIVTIEFQTSIALHRLRSSSLKLNFFPKRRKRTWKWLTVKNFERTEARIREKNSLTSRVAGEENKYATQNTESCVNQRRNNIAKKNKSNREWKLET